MFKITENYLFRIQTFSYTYKLIMINDVILYKNTFSQSRDKCHKHKIAPTKLVFAGHACLNQRISKTRLIFLHRTFKNDYFKASKIFL
jgi:hypothetical protein